MSEDNEPDQWAEQLAQFQRMIRDNEPMIRQIQQVQAMIRSGEAIRRQIEPIIKAAEQLTRSDGWPLPPFQRRLIRAVETAMHEILTPRGPVVHHVTLTDSGSAVDTLAVAGAATASGSAPMPQVRVATQVERGIGQILALVLVAIVTSGLLGVQGPDRAAVDHYLTVLSFALPIAVLIWSKQNRQK